MLNVTVDMFGNSINLVELGGRVQGLERIVEKFFGPNGYFGQKETPELMDNKRQTANYISSFDNTVSLFCLSQSFNPGNLLAADDNGC